MVATHPAQSDATASQTRSRQNGRFGMRTGTVKKHERTVKKPVYRFAAAPAQ
jgi:hypothetical protein